MYALTLSQYIRYLFIYFVRAEYNVISQLLLFLFVFFSAENPQRILEVDGNYSSEPTGNVVVTQSGRLVNPRVSAALNGYGLYGPRRAASMKAKSGSKSYNVLYSRMEDGTYVM